MMGIECVIDDIACHPRADPLLVRRRNIYSTIDHNVTLNHGGTELGQGLDMKVAQVVVPEFGLSIGRVKITVPTTEKVPYSSPTAASSGSDLKGKTAQAAAIAICEWMVGAAAKELNVATTGMVFADGLVIGGDRSLSFAAGVMSR
jgi:xanthine dehydrogenase large subunit